MQPLRISPSRANELLELAKTGSDALLSAALEFKQFSGWMFRVTELTRTFSKALPSQAASTLAEFLTSIQRWSQFHEVTPRDVLDALADGFRVDGWTQLDKDSWQTIRSTIEEIVDDRRLIVLTKASDLYYSHQFHLHSFKIISDLRPVLDDRRSEIIAMFCMNTLQITYSDGAENETSAFISLDIEEMIRLKGEIEVAIAKTKKLGEEFGQKYYFEVNSTSRADN